MRCALGEAARINHGIIATPEHGKVMFRIPYLADYVKKEEKLPRAACFNISRQFLRHGAEIVKTIALEPKIRYSKYVQKMLHGAKKV